MTTTADRDTFLRETLSVESHAQLVTRCKSLGLTRYSRMTNVQMRLAILDWMFGPKPVTPAPAPEWLPEPYKPVEVSDLLLAFPASVRHLMPEPGTFDRLTRWEELANEWFADGVDDLSLLPSTTLVRTFDTEPEFAWRHLRAILGSYEPKHEHKIAAMGVLLGTWFRYAQWTTSTGIKKEIGTQQVLP